MMIVTKDTKLKVDITGVEIHSYEEAVTIFQKGNALAKIADEVRGSALQWVKENEREQYPDFVADMGITLNRATALIAHSRLVQVAKELGEDHPTKASSTVKLPGKTPEQKLDSYHEIQKESGKKEPGQKDIENYKKKLSQNGYNQNPQRIDSEKRLSSDDEEIEGSENRSQNPSSDHREDRSEKEIEIKGSENRSQNPSSKQKDNKKVIDAEVVPPNHTAEREQEKLREKAHDNKQIMSLEEEVHKAVIAYIEATQKEYDRLGVNNLGTKYDVDPNYEFYGVIGSMLYQGKIEPF